MILIDLLYGCFFVFVFYFLFLGDFSYTLISGKWVDFWLEMETFHLLLLLFLFCLVLFLLKKWLMPLKVGTLKRGSINN